MDEKTNSFKKTIFTKTAKGLSESVGRARTLPRELREILKEIDGTSSVEDLVSVLGIPDDKLEEGLRKLVSDDYIHEFVPPAVVDDEFDLGPLPGSTTTDPLTEVTLGSFLRAAEEQAQNAGARQDGDRSRRESEQRDAEERARKEAEEELRRLSERAKRAEEARAKRAAEKQARQEARERARKDKEAAAQAAAHAKPHGDHGERSDRSSKKEQAARHAAKEEPMQNAKTAERHSARKHPKREEPEAAQERAVGIAADPVVSMDGKPYRERFALPFRWPLRSPFGSEPRKKVRWHKPLAIAASIAFVAGTAIAFLTTYDGKQAQLESYASAQFGQPVKIGAVRLSPLPMPHWKLENVSIGKDGQIRIPRVDMMAGFGSLFGEQSVYSAVVLTSPTVTEEGLGWLMFGRGASPKDPFRFESISATGAKLASERIELPVFDIEAGFYDDGSWRNASLLSDDKTIHVNLHPQRDTVQVELVADAFTPPFGAAMKFDSFHASGIASRTGLTLSTYSGKLLNGFIDGRAVLTWAPGWKLEGDLRVTQIDTPPLAPQLLDGGKLDGNASFAMEAPTAAQLLPALRESGKLDGSITIHSGAILGVNIASVLRGISAGGRSPFTLLEASVSQGQGKTQLHDLHAEAGAISVGGNVEVDAKDKLGGHLAVDLHTPSRQTRAFVNLGGTRNEPHYHK